MPINITIPTNWLTRRNIPAARYRTTHGTTDAERAAGLETLQELAMSRIMEQVMRALADNDTQIRPAPPVPARQNLQYRVYVEPDFGGGMLASWIQRTDTARHLKGIVEEEMEVPVERQRLGYLGQDFGDGEMMEKYLVEEGAVDS
ncbi:hypothetical protein DOTSEDRAFT_54710 [Dothistroma septosporum NZE10]|uniref:Ubiquitin-like domain-containing protein n=1 Tax=Dothistroma septosporum (strain NZE10 / CBS 128990) TaxID=675120 RepID=N1PI74_DOTSN|nr:hypothetical protein DOTSEDRAFT_54710 [Dothistroma septosporum NZE10]